MVIYHYNTSIKICKFKSISKAVKNPDLKSHEQLTCKHNDNDPGKHVIAVVTNYTSL